MAEEEAAASNKTLNMVANGMLALSGLWGLQSAQERPIIGAAFGLYAAKGIFAVLQEMMDDENVKKGAEFTKRLAWHFGIPLIATDLTKPDCVPILPTVVEYFLIPLADFFSEELEVEVDKRMLAASQGFALGSTLTCVAGKDSEPLKGGFVHAFLASLFAQGNIAEEYTTAFVAVAVYLTWATLTGHLPKF